MICKGFSLTLPGNSTPGRIQWAAKPVGWDNDRVLSEVPGCDHSEILRLEKGGIVGKWSNLPGRKPPEEGKA
ncbi:MAG: hypothetical protein OHK0028_17900 [Deltaproteobacteria bacterium]